jgi:hypothetical protein
MEQDSELGDGETPLSEEEQAALDAKRATLEKEKKELLASLAGGDFSTQKAKVASVLNLYPPTRNSGVTLALKYWEMFQPDIYNENGILPKDLFKLERFHLIVRARAKIQNEYGLFVADGEIKKRRRKREEEMNEEVLKDVAPRKVVNVFSDETGKNADYVIVASVWVLTGRAVFTVSQVIKAWKEQSGWGAREIHFANFGRRDEEPLGEYLRVIVANREFLSFKAIAIERARTKRKVEEIVEKLHEHMLIRGAEHEAHTGRIELPREIEMTLDEEQSLDSFTLAELSRRVTADLERTYGDQLKLCDVRTASSKNSHLVQLADLVAGAINRKLNHKGERNYKDDMADRIIHDLDLTLSSEGVAGLDSAALFKV